MLSNRLYSIALSSPHNPWLVFLAPLFDELVVMMGVLKCLLVKDGKGLWHLLLGTEKDSNKKELLCLSIYV